MYQYELLLIIGMVASALLLLMVLYLIVSYKRTKLIRRNFDEETKITNVLDTTIQTIQSTRLTTGFSVDNSDVVTVFPEIAQNEALIPTEPDFDMEADIPTDVHGFLSIKPIKDFDSNLLEGQYLLQGEIGGGGMSRVFLARKQNTGNDWIVKYISQNEAKLSNEAEILKELNHPSLPKIVDIFENEGGLCLVESYVEGINMQRVLHPTDDTVKTFPEFRIFDWAEQLSQALDYLHKMPLPIYHHDLKPANIMVTYGDKLIVIDFGISRRNSDISRARAITYRYAAPEQFKGRTSDRSKGSISTRFGSLPEAHTTWPIDSRADIYSLGVILFEAAVGDIPTVHNHNLLKLRLSKGLCDIIYKCIEIDPADRYQSAEELLSDITYYRQRTRPKMHTALWRRMAVKVASVLLIPISVFCLSMGMVTRTLAAETELFIFPEILTISVRQSSEVQVTGFSPEIDNALVRLFVNEGEQELNPNNLNWEAETNYIAQVDGSRIIGLNVGETTIHGHYRASSIALRVSVVEPMNGMVDISMRFHPGNLVSLYAGTAYLDRVDGTLGTAEFVSPESMAVTENGAIYIADAGFLRRIYNGAVETIYIYPTFITPRLVRAYQDNLFILTHIWQDDDMYFMAIVRLYSGGMELIYQADARFVYIQDMAVSNGYIHILERDTEPETAFLRTIDLNDITMLRTVTEVPRGVSSIYIKEDIIFMADETFGTLMYFDGSQIVHLAGAEGERHFIDSTAPLFYRPTRIRYHKGSLYVWDFNVLRKIILEGDVARETISIAGVASPEFSMDFEEYEAAEQIVLPFSILADFVHLENEILLSDPRRGVIWQISE